MNLPSNDIDTGRILLNDRKEIFMTFSYKPANPFPRSMTYEDHANTALGNVAQDLWRRQGLKGLYRS